MHWRKTPKLRALQWVFNRRNLQLNTLVIEGMSLTVWLFSILFFQLYTECFIPDIWKKSSRNKSKIFYISVLKDFTPTKPCTLATLGMESTSTYPQTYKQFFQIVSNFKKIYIYCGVISSKKFEDKRDNWEEEGKIRVKRKQDKLHVHT